MKRPIYYEDDAIEYTYDGRFPKIPEKYRYCFYNFKNYIHKLKSFRTYEIAKIALIKSYKKKYNYNYVSENKVLEEFKIFKCDKCRLYHIMSIKNYNWYFYKKQYGSVLNLYY